MVPLATSNQQTIQNLQVIEFLTYSRKILLMENNNNLLAVLKAVFSYTKVESTGRMEQGCCTIPNFLQISHHKFNILYLLDFNITVLMLFLFFYHYISFSSKTYFSSRYILCKCLSVFILSQSWTYCLLRISSVTMLFLQK